MLKERKDGRRYIFCNIDEPYAEAVYTVIKCGQMAKGENAWPEGDMSFKNWIEWTWGDKPKSTEPLPCPNPPLEAIVKRLVEVMEASEALLNDVRRRYPEIETGGFSCPFFRAIEQAIAKAKGVS